MYLIKCVVNVDSADFLLCFSCCMKAIPGSSMPSIEKHSSKTKNGKALYLIISFKDCK